MSGKPKLPRITEPDEGLVHYQNVPGIDLVTLCGLTDFLGHKRPGKPTRAAVNCIACKAMVSFVQRHEP